MNACNSIKSRQQNEPVKKWEIVKCCQINKRLKKGTTELVQPNTYTFSTHALI